MRLFAEIGKEIPGDALLQEFGGVFLVQAWMVMVERLPTHGPEAGDLDPGAVN